MADDKVIIQLELDSKEADLALNQFGKNAKKVIGDTEQSVAGMSGRFKEFGSSVAAGLATAVAAFAGLKHAIDEAVEGDKAIRQLASAIAGTGEFSQEALKSFQDFAQSISELTGIDDDVILSSLSLAKSFGITNDQAQQLVKAAVNLSAVTGQELDSAIKQLGGTFDGTIGKLSNLGSEFRDLTAEQAKNGDVIKLINKNYGEAGASIGDSFEGGLNKLKNTFNDTFKAIGQQILGDASITQGLKAIGEALVALTPIIVSFTKYFVEGLKTIATAITGTVTLLTGAASVIAEYTGFKEVSKSLDEFGTVTFKATESLAGSLGVTADATKENDKLSKALQKVSDNAKTAGKDGGKAAQELADKFKKSQEEAQKFVGNIIQGSGSEVEQIGKKAGEQFAKIQSYYDQNLISFEQAEKARLAIASEVTDKIDKITDKQYRENLDRIEKESAAREKALEEQQKIATTGVNAATAAAQGGDEKQRFQGLGSILTGILSAFGPIGTAIGSFANALGQLNKEQAKEYAEAFIRSAPEFVRVVAENAPAFAAGIIKAIASKEFIISLGQAFIQAAKSLYLFLPTVLDEVFDGALSRFGESLLQKIGPAIAEFGNSIGQAFANFFNDFGNLFDGLGDRLADAFAEGGEKIRDAFFEPVQKLIDFLDNFKFPEIGGKGGGDGLIAEFGQRIGLARGGIVPTYAAGGVFVPRGTDTVPAMLTPGELVVPTDMVSQLGSFLDSSSSGGTQEALLAAILSAIREPMSVESEVKVNEQTFADIILKLNRQNARLTA